MIEGDGIYNKQKARLNLMTLEGRLYEQIFARWLEAGIYANHLPGELHSPFNRLSL